MRTECVVGVQSNAEDFRELFQRYSGGVCFDLRLESRLFGIRGV